MKKRMLLFVAGIVLISLPTIVAAQHDAETYIPVKDPLVEKNLEQWQDMKFGLFMHWGTYSQWGVVESWSLCNEDWCGRRRGRHENYADYRTDYEALQKTFNPVDFDPDKWVKAADKAGMKYVVFTTKHHDGFCMFDTKTTDYKITSPNTPFHTNPRANITKEIFDTFRKNNFKIGTYFSKPDWHSEDYWWSYRATGDRHVNYNPAKYPERWNNFKKFTSTQIEELMTDYGQIDVLWLDGAWVRPINNMPEEFKEWAEKKDWNQDIDMAGISKMARSHQPGLIVVDRWVSGEFENYLTPENKVPEKAITVPWESCITITGGWAYNENQKYKSAEKLIHMMVDIVSKGGNFLLNIAPSPLGDWAPDAYDRLDKIGDWMDVNSSAIYSSRPIAPYKDGNVCLTQNKDTKEVYAIYLGEEGINIPPSKVWLNSIQPADGAVLTMLGVKGKLKWEKVGTGVLVHIPKSIQNKPPCKYAWTIKISEIKQ